jgi:hypothetical protein
MSSIILYMVALNIYPLDILCATHDGKLPDFFLWDIEIYCIEATTCKSVYPTQVMFVNDVYNRQVRMRMGYSDY